MTTGPERPVRRRGDALFGRVGLTGLVLLVGSLTVAIVVLSFAVRVSGTSMEPTLRDGDRLEVEVFGSGDPDRFDLVEANQPGARDSGGGTRIVKRVIGMPGDEVSVVGDPTAPRVMVRAAGSSDVWVVDNPSWTDRIGSSTASCCNDEGRSTRSPTWVRVPEDSYWLIGDNWGGSTDSRVFGFVTRDEIRSRLRFRVLPVTRFGWLTSPARLVPAQG
jgi:signal peptidase I